MQHNPPTSSCSAGDHNMQYDPVVGQGWGAKERWYTCIGVISCLRRRTPTRGLVGEYRWTVRVSFVSPFRAGQSTAFLDLTSADVSFSQSSDQKIKETRLLLAGEFLQRRLVAARQRAERAVFSFPVLSGELTDHKGLPVRNFCKVFYSIFTVSMVHREQLIIVKQIHMCVPGPVFFVLFCFFLLAPVWLYEFDYHLISKGCKFQQMLRLQ